MRRLRKDQILIVWAAVGILLATAGANGLFASGILDYREIYEFLQKGWTAAAGRESGKTIRILAVRVIQTLAAAWLCCGRRRQAVAIVLPMLAGVNMAFIMVLATWYWGMTGIFHVLVLWLPHSPCYLVLWSGFLLYGIYGSQVRKSRFWSAMAVLFLLGIFLEILIHPLFAGFI